MSAVLFDMDGVLVDSEDYWVAFLEEKILPTTVPDEEIPASEASGMNFREIYDYLEAEYDTALSRETFESMFHEMARELYTERVTLLEGLYDLLAELEARGITTAVVTSAPHEWIELVFDRFDLEGRFDHVISADDIDADGKPAPDIFEHAAAETGSEPTDCVVVEDSENGVRAASRAETTVIAYRIDAHGEIDLSPADDIVDSPAELRDAVLELASH